MAAVPFNKVLSGAATLERAQMNHRALTRKPKDGPNLFHCLGNWPLPHHLSLERICSHPLLTHDVSQIRYLTLEQSALEGLKFQAMTLQFLKNLFHVSHVALEVRWTQSFH